MFDNLRRGRQARNVTKNVPKILDLKSSSEQIFSGNWRWVPCALPWEVQCVMKNYQQNGRFHSNRQIVVFLTHTQKRTSLQICNGLGNAISTTVLWKCGRLCSLVISSKVKVRISVKIFVFLGFLTNTFICIENVLQDISTKLNF